MRLQVTLALICVLFPKAPALQCYQCYLGQIETCTDTQTSCPDQCFSKTYFQRYDDQPQQAIEKGCAAAEECVSESINLGFWKTDVNTKCCSTDFCNSQTPPALSRAPNGRKCYTCVDNDCTKTLNCEGIEDRCITINETESDIFVTKKGCVSQNVCESRSRTWGKKEPRFFEMSCCKGNLCNSAAGVKLSLLIMLVPLLSSFFL